MNQPIRVTCINPNLSSYGMIGTVVGSERGEDDPVRPGVLCDVIWLDYLDEDADEIDGGNLGRVTEATYLAECVRFDREDLLNDGVS